jgi:hypothetical protein
MFSSAKSLFDERAYNLILRSRVHEIGVCGSVQLEKERN